jgi:hypothetical protein
MLVHDLLIEEFLSRNKSSQKHYAETHEDAEPRLYVSSLGGCARQGFLSAFDHLSDHPFHVETSYPFDDYTIERMELGNELENLTWKALHNKLDGSIARNVPVGNEIWAGRIDFLIAQTPEFPSGLIVEHKGTSPWNFKPDRLPYLTHCYQVLAYESLLEPVVGYKVPAKLYYRSWDNWAELLIQESSYYPIKEYTPVIECSGYINGSEVYRSSGRFTR